MKKLNEDVAISDPQLAQQYANGQTQLMNKDKQINALQKQINSIEQQKNEIQKAMAMIQQKAAQAQPKQPEQQNNTQDKNTQGKQQTVQVTGQPVQQTSESLLIKENKEYSYIEQLSHQYNNLTDKLATIMNNDPYNYEAISDIKFQIRELSNELDELEYEEELNKQNREQELYWRENESIKYNNKNMLKENISGKVYLQKLNDELEYLNDKLDLAKKSNTDPRLISMIMDEIESTLDEIRIIQRNLYKEKSHRHSVMAESKNPISYENFYNLNEDYIDIDNQIEEDEQFIFYLKIREDDNIFIAKVFKLSPDGEWYGLVKIGEDSAFEKISYEPQFDEDDIVDFLEDTYDEVEIIDILEFNEYIEDSESLEF